MFLLSWSVGKGTWDGCRKEGNGLSVYNLFLTVPIRPAACHCALRADLGEHHYIKSVGTLSAMCVSLGNGRYTSPTYPWPLLLRASNSSSIQFSIC